MIIREDYAIYTSTESRGLDLVIKDSVGRYAILSTADIGQLVEDLVNFSIQLRGEDSVDTPFDLLGK